MKKTGNAIRALGRMTQLQKAFKLSDTSFSNSSKSGTSVNTSTQESVMDDSLTETADSQPVSPELDENRNNFLELDENDE